MNYRKRMLAAALAAVMTMGMFSGCSKEDTSASTSNPGAASSEGTAETEMMDLSEITDPFLTISGIAGDSVVARVGGYDITAAEVLYWLNGQVESYLVQFRNMGYDLKEIPWDAELNDDVTMEDTVLNSALETAAFYRLLPVLSEKVGLELTQDEIDFPNQDLDMSAQELGGRELLDYWLWFRMMDEPLYIQVYHNGCLFEKLQDYYYGEGSEGYPTDAEVKAYAEDELGYYRVKHILLKTAERVTGEDGAMAYEALPEDVVAEKKALAEDLLQQLKQTADPETLFDELMHRYSEDPGLEVAPEGYVAYPGQMVKPFEEASLNLAIDEISGLVKSDDGYHIILRLPLELEQFRGQLISQRSDTQIMQWLDEYGIETTELYEQIDPSTVRSRFLQLQASLQGELEQAIISLYEKNEDKSNSGS